MIVQFKGEDRKESIANHFSFDIEEEYLFFIYIHDMGYTIDADDEIIESLYEMWCKKKSEA